MEDPSTQQQDLWLTLVIPFFGLMVVLRLEVLEMLPPYSIVAGGAEG